MNVFQSINDFNEAKQVIPGGVNVPIHTFGSMDGTPLFIARGKGAYLYDEDGNEYVDFTQAGGSLIFGHGDPTIESAIREALQDGLSFDTPIEKETTLAKQIITLSQSVEKLRLMNSTLEAMMSALRLARAWSGKDDVIGFDGCFYGNPEALSAVGESTHGTSGMFGFAGIMGDSQHILMARYNDIESVRLCFEQSQNVGCVIIEAIAGRMGFVPADEAFMKQLKALCEQYNALLIIDETLSGFRVGMQGAIGLYGIEADLVIFGHIIGGSLPLVAFGGRAEIMDSLSPLGEVHQAGLLTGNQILTTAGIATFAMLKSNPQIFTQLEALARRLVEGLREASKACSISMQADYRGSMFGLCFNEHIVKNFDDACKSDGVMFARFHQKMLERGVYFARSQFMSGFVCVAMDEEMIDEVIVKARGAFDEISGEKIYE